MPKNLDALIDYADVIKESDLKDFQKVLDNNHIKLEMLHLVMRCVYPEKKAAKFDKTDFRNFLLKSDQQKNSYLGTVNYAKINSQIYRDIVKRKKLWNI